MFRNVNTSVPRVCVKSHAEPRHYYASFCANVDWQSLYTVTALYKRTAQPKRMREQEMTLRYTVTTNMRIYHFFHMILDCIWSHVDKLDRAKNYHTEEYNPLIYTIFI